MERYGPERGIVMNKILIAATVLTTAITLTATAQQNTYGNTDLVGNWQSQGCESFAFNNQPAYMKRNFEFTSSTWQLRFTLFADPGCTVALISTRLSGPYTLGDAAALPNTRKITWGQTAKFVTPQVPDILNAMNGSGCGDAKKALGEERDVGTSGCVAFGVGSVKDYPQEYDLLKLEKGQLFTGLRNNNMNIEANRPTKIFEFALVKK